MRGFIVLQFLLMVPVVASWIIMLVALWRVMKAHEFIAATLEEFADNPE